MIATVILRKYSKTQPFWSRRNGEESLARLRNKHTILRYKAEQKSADPFVCPSSSQFAGDLRIPGEGDQRSDPTRVLMRPVDRRLLNRFRTS